VDLTPMVDLGFLLITFFIFTTTMSQPTSMHMNLPKDVQKPEDQNKLKESAALTVMPGKQNQVYYYEGLDPTKIQTSNFKTIRDVILDKKRRTDPKDFMVIIKPTQDASYKNTVDILDEMKIDDVKRYALVDITPDEYKIIVLTEQANGIK
jgi:biopolymer transport protein ExbD